MWLEILKKQSRLWKMITSFEVDFKDGKTTKMVAMGVLTTEQALEIVKVKFAGKAENVEPTLATMDLYSAQNIAEMSELEDRRAALAQLDDQTQARVKKLLLQIWENKKA